MSEGAYCDNWHDRGCYILTSCPNFNSKNRNQKGKQQTPINPPSKPITPETQAAQRSSDDDTREIAPDW